MAAGVDTTVGARRHYNQRGRSVGARIAGTAAQSRNSTRIVCVPPGWSSVVPVLAALSFVFSQWFLHAGDFWRTPVLADLPGAI